MKKVGSTVLRTSLATFLLVTVGGNAKVVAQPWVIKGSSSLGGVMRDSIANAGLSSVLTYSETTAADVEGALAQTYPPRQRIAPMTRNFQSGWIQAHPNWAPQQQNIIGIDPIVIVEKKNASGYSRCPSIPMAMDPYSPGLAKPGNLLQLVLGGYDGQGDKVACSHPDRLAALDALAGCFGGISFIEHFYVPDSSWGTSEIKTKLRINGFCNGRSFGPNSPGSNMANDDADPIRHSCVPADTSHAKTRCTLYPSTATCTAGSSPNCTQGLVVALSEKDPNMPDVTTSIGVRVQTDGNNATLGLANRAASRLQNTQSINLNSISPSDFSVRASMYFLARRLFVNWSDLPIGFDRAGGRNADDIAHDAQETALFTWMTDNVWGGGRGEVDQILKAHGFLPCTDDFSDPSGPGNLCSSQLPPPPGDFAESNGCVPAGVAIGSGYFACFAPEGPCTAVYDRCSSTPSSLPPGTICPAYACSARNFACVGSGQGTCCAGMTCTDQGTGYSACN